MRNLYLSAGLLLSVLLFCTSCAGRHEKNLQSMQGMHISQAISSLGQPSESGDGYYVWQRNWQVQRGDYYTTRYKTVKHYDKKGKFTGTSEVPYEEYVKPYTQHLSCTTRLYFNSSGLITKYELEGNGCN